MALLGPPAGENGQNHTFGSLFSDPLRPASPQSPTIKEKDTFFTTLPGSGQNMVSHRKWVFFWAQKSVTKKIFLCPPGVKAYEELSSGELCSSGRGIKSEQECRKAAETLQMPFAKSWNGNNDFPGCLIANDGRNKVYFNLSPYPSNIANNPKYGAICTTTLTAGEFGFIFRCHSISYQLPYS